MKKEILINTALISLGILLIFGALLFSFRLWTILPHWLFWSLWTLDILGSILTIWLYGKLH